MDKMKLAKEKKKPIGECKFCEGRGVVEITNILRKRSKAYLCDKHYEEQKPKLKHSNWRIRAI